MSGAGSAAKVATFDTNKETGGRDQDGSIQFAVDQQPFLRGYLAVDTLWLYRTNGNFPGGSQEPVLTGRAFITNTGHGCPARDDHAMRPVASHHVTVAAVEAAVDFHPRVVGLRLRVDRPEAARGLRRPPRN